MKSESFGVEIVSDATHLNCELSVPRATICVRRSEKSNGIVSFLNDEHSDYFLIAIYDEVTSELIGIFVKFDQFLLAKPAQMTAVGSDHDWDFTQ